MKIVNMTPHDIHFYSEEGEKLHTFPALGDLVRVNTKVREAGNIGGFRLVKKESPDIVFLPPKKEGVMYIVSLITKSSCPHREDLLTVDDTIRDEKGRIIGCKAFCI